MPIKISGTIFETARCQPHAISIAQTTHGEAQSNPGKEIDGKIQ